jgi:hypothetical protein
MQSELLRLAEEARAARERLRALALLLAELRERLDAVPTQKIGRVA